MNCFYSNSHDGQHGRQPAALDHNKCLILLQPSSCKRTPRLQDTRDLQLPVQANFVLSRPIKQQQRLSSPCPIMHHCVPSCTTVSHHAPPCPIMHHRVPSCTTTGQSDQVYQPTVWNPVKSGHFPRSQRKEWKLHRPADVSHLLLKKNDKNAFSVFQTVTNSFSATRGR